MSMESQIADRLNGLQIGNYGIHKSTAVDGKKEVTWLTVYSTCCRDDEFDEQLSFTPVELVRFCAEIMRNAETLATCVNSNTTNTPARAEGAEG